MKTTEAQRLRNNAKAKAWRDRHPEKAKESRRRCDNKRRHGTDWKPKPKEDLGQKRAVRIAMIKNRLEYLQNKSRLAAPIGATL